MTTTWTIAVDWQRNGDFSSPNDDVTAYVISAKWQLGFAAPYQDVADDGVLDLILNNADKRFSPENNTSPLYGKLVPLRPVRIQSNDGTTTRTQWFGWIQSIQPFPGQYGQRQAHIVAAGAMSFLKVAETKLALQQNKRTDEIIDLLMREVIMPPALTNATLLDIPGHAELDVTTWLASTAFYEVFDTGIVTMSIAGDNWVNDGGYSDKPKDTFDVYRAIKDMTTTERGKFFFDRDGKAVFWNRQHLLKAATSAATLTDTMTGLEYTYAGPDMLQNDIVVVCHPRVIGATDQEPLWELPADSAVRVDPGKPREVYVKYEDPTTRGRIGAQDVHINGLTVEIGSVTVKLDAQANGANLTFTNSGTGPAYVTACQVKGRKIVDSGQMEAREIDQLSIGYYGRRTMRLNLSSLMSLDDAAQIAKFEKQRRATPKGDVQSVTMLSHARNGGSLHTDQLARTLGDQITLSETQTQHTANYWIIGEAHEIKGAGMLYQTTWYLERTPTVTYFVVDSSKLDTANAGTTFHPLAY